MSYNGSGTFNINTTGQPVVAGTVISAATFNALTADLATGLTTALTKDGQTTATVRIPFAQGISSTLVTDASSVSTRSIITAGGVGIAKKLYVGTDANIAGTLAVTGVATYSAQPIFSSLTASSAVATDASKGLVSVANTGTGSNVLATAPTIASANLTTALTLAGAAGTNGQVLTSAGSGLPTWTTVATGITLGTPVASTSGTAINFTGIPSGTKRIVVAFSTVSTNGTDTLVVKIGDAGGIEEVGSSVAMLLDAGVALSSAGGSEGYYLNTVSTAAHTYHGKLTIDLINSSINSWVGSSSLYTVSGDIMFVGVGRFSLTDQLTQLRITTISGTDTFDAGSINITYE